MHKLKEIILQNYFHSEIDSQFLQINTKKLKDWNIFL